MRNLCVIKIKEKVFKVRIRRSKPTRAILGLAVDIQKIQNIALSSTSSVPISPPRLLISMATYSPSSSPPPLLMSLSPKSEKIVDICKNCTYSFRRHISDISDFCSKGMYVAKEQSSTISFYLTVCADFFQIAKYLSLYAGVIIPALTNPVTEQLRK